MYIWTSPRWSPDLDCRRQQAWLYSLTCLPLGWGKASMLHSHSHKRHYGETLPPSPHSVQRQRKCNLFSRATPPAANTTAPTPRLSGAATGRKQNPKILQAESTGNHAEWHVQEDGKDLELVQIETPFLEMFLPFLGTLEIPVLLTTHTPYENSHYHRPPELATEHQMSSEETKASLHFLLATMVQMVSLPCSWSLAEHAEQTFVLCISETVKNGNSITNTLLHWTMTYLCVYLLNELLQKTLCDHMYRALTHEVRLSEWHRNTLYIHTESFSSFAFEIPSAISAIPLAISRVNFKQSYPESIKG